MNDISTKKVFVKKGITVKELIAQLQLLDHVQDYEIYVHGEQENSITNDIIFLRDSKEKKYYLLGK